MVDKAEPGGFLGRWSRRKLDQKEGRAVEPDPVSAPAPLVVATPSPRPSPASGRGSQEVQAELAPPEPKAPPPTLEDAAALTPASDFKPFMAGDVAPQVRNAAMKKLFADPHFNVMDRLDTYIDDYSQADPIPESMLRQMVSAKFLNLFPEEEPNAQVAGSGEPEAPAARDDADSPPPADLSQSASAEPGQQDTTTHDAHADLRLQPDDAAQTQGPGRGTA
jgi:hypothetical protein